MNHHHPRLAYVLLAAGAATRFGQCKQLATIDFKKTLLEHALECALGVAPGEVFLVLGANQERIESTLALRGRFPRVHILSNPDWRAGVASSIACAVHHVLDDAFDGVLIMLADQVAVRPEQLKSLRDRWFDHAERIVCAEYDDTLGAPAIFPRRYCHQLINLVGDKGAKWLIHQESEHVLAVPLPEARWDIDTERQLNDWQLDAL